ncbi:hypothetical protein [Armatimonas rosea]|uniref:Uncharacterized protein n=1 Tax=Armatimonas rosea TaxID=685828 RepID=A0A7W9SR96_ARMRO|nr:hypothetical protein [Armatimonas rosea]MBB6051372.1 hypothetical protein [Armatimonas rosea]
MPSEKAIKTYLEDTLQIGAHLYGIELSVVGTVQKQGETLWLVSRKTGERLPLVPLTQKVQWDTKGKCAAPLLDSERSTYARLQTLVGKPVTVTGPLRAGQLEVRLLSPLSSPLSKGTP